jgi:hypothetical protein
VIARLVLIATFLVATSARAQIVTEPAPPPWPDPKKFAKGLFAAGELGALAFVGNAGKYAGPGVSFGVRIGYDLFRFLAVQAHILGASQDTNTPPPTFGQSFQTYVYAGEAKVTVQLRRFAIFAEGGAGLLQLSSNVLDQVGVTHGSRFSLAILAGGGLDYHTLNRHFSVGVGADYLLMPSLTGGHAIIANVYLRYTR